MNTKLLKKIPNRLTTLLIIGMTLVPITSYAVVNLVALEGQWSPGGGALPITMWGFVTDIGQACDSLPDWTVGPQLKEADLKAGNLTIKLRNCLSESVSIVIPGQPAVFSPQTMTDDSGRIRVTSFTHEAPAYNGTNAGTAAYTWTGVKDGTYLYQSGSHPAKQVQMGLYGALTVGSYPSTSGDLILLYSEIDPSLHNPPRAATPLGYQPKHFLVNGSNSNPVLMAGNSNAAIVLRFLNAGLDFHVPTLNGTYMNLVAEDGNPYPYPKQEYSVQLPPGKTIDALWNPSTIGTYMIYDRRGNGMYATLNIANELGAPIAIDDVLTVNEDSTLSETVTFTDDSVPLSGVLANDTMSDGMTKVLVPPTVAILVDLPSHGVLDWGEANDGSCVYTPDPDFNGVDTFTYKTNDGSLDSNLATVTITVNPMQDVPIANPGGPYTAVVDVPLNLDGRGSTDIDDDTLTYRWDFDHPSAELTGDGETPMITYATTGTHTVALIVNDGTDDSVIATTTVAVNVATPNSPPYADAGGPYTAAAGLNGALITLNGTGSSDPDGDPLTYEWDTNGDGSFKDASGATPTVNFPNPGNFIVALRVHDGTAYSSSSTVVTITNIPPVAIDDVYTVSRRSKNNVLEITGNDEDVVIGGISTIDDRSIETDLASTKGSVKIGVGRVLYTPPKGKNWVSDSFMYTVRDIYGEVSNKAEVIISQD